MFRAVVTGFVVWIVLWVVAGRVVVAVFPQEFDPLTKTTGSAGMQLLRIFISVVVSLVAGWTAAAVARRRARRAALILGALVLAVGAFFEIGRWSLAPPWAHVVFLALLLPAIRIGALLPALARK